MRSFRPALPSDSVKPLPRPVGPGFEIRAARRPGFTLLEALVAIAVAALAGSVLLAGINASVKVTDEAMNETIALGLAQQLMDEVLGCRYLEYGSSAYPTTLGPTTAEASTGTRSAFDDIGDFNGVSSRPPVDRWGIEVGQEDTGGTLRHASFRLPGSFFSRWREQVSVYYVSDSDPATALAAGRTSDTRAVEVSIVYVDPQRGERNLASLRRVVVYVPPLD